MKPGFLFFLLLFVFAWRPAQAQEKSISFEQYLAIVKEHHPFSLQAEIALKKGEAVLTNARGGFDPLIKAAYDNKRYGGKEYYGIFDAGLIVPTWFGIEAKAGYQSNQGIYLNPEDVIPSSGLWYAGLSLPLGQGLFIDQRRADLAKAKLFASATSAERLSMLNDLLFEARQAYLGWAQAWVEVQVLEEGIALASERLTGIKTSAVKGDRAIIDTLEASIQVQNFQVQYAQALLRLQNARLQASVFLWREGAVPLEIANETRPQALTEISAPAPLFADSLQMLIQDAMLNHPDLLLSRNKISMLDVERKLKAEKIKPKLMVSYNLLQQASGQNPFAAMTPQNYKAGISFSSPILIREARGDLKFAKLKIQESSLALSQKTLELETKIRSYANEMETLSGQVELYTRTVGDYLKMLEAERTNFNAGESSMFLVNAREQSYLNAKLKLAELQAKFRKAGAGLLWASGKPGI